MEAEEERLHLKSVEHFLFSLDFSRGWKWMETVRNIILLATQQKNLLLPTTAKSTLNTARPRLSAGSVGKKVNSHSDFHRLLSSSAEKRL